MAISSNTRLSKACATCHENSTCPRPSAMVRKCYQRWYNRNQRDSEVEKLRQALFRQKNFAASMLSRSKFQASKSNVYFGLDLKWFKSELAKGKCAATGISFVLPSYQPGARGKRGPWTPSVDRIDNSKGYTRSNSRLVVWIYNLAKNSYDEADVHKMCAAFVHRSKLNTDNGAPTQRALAITTVPVSAVARRTSSSCWLRDNSVEGTSSVVSQAQVGGGPNASK